MAARAREGRATVAGEGEAEHAVRRLKTLLLALPGFTALCRGLTRGHARAFMYHRFTDDTATYPRRMSVSVFRRQLTYLAATCDVGRPADQARLESGAAAGGRPLAVVTVDDGYLDFHDHAWPVLRDLGLPSTLFVTSGFVSGAVWMWWDRIMWILEATDHESLAFPFRGSTVEADLVEASGRARAWQILVPALRFVPDREKEALVADLARVLDVEVPSVAPPRYAPCTWEQLAAMAADGVTMAGHTRTHPILSRVDAAQGRDEITGSREEMAAHLGEAPAWFAYPQGGPADFTPATVALVQEAGYKDAYVAYYDPSLAGEAFARHRYHAVSDWTDFRWTACGAEHLVQLLRRRLGLPTTVSINYWQGSDLAGGRGITP